MSNDDSADRTSDPVIRFGRSHLIVNKVSTRRPNQARGLTRTLARVRPRPAGSIEAILKPLDRDASQAAAEALLGRVRQRSGIELLRLGIVCPFQIGTVARNRLGHHPLQCN